MPEPITITVGSMHWTIDPAWRDRLLGAQGIRLDEWLQGGQARIVKQGPHRTVYRVAFGAEAVYVKHNRPWNLRAWLRELVRPAKSRIEYAQARAVAARGIDTFEPLALGETTSLAPAGSFLVTRALVDTQPLSQFLQIQLGQLDRLRQGRLRKTLAHSLADFIRRLHEQGIVHHDLHPGNILIRLEADDQARFFLIDLHATTLGRPLTKRACAENLALLNNWFSLHVGRTDRLRFWKTYAGPAADRQDAIDLERETLRGQQRFWMGRDVRCLGNNRYFRRIRQTGLAGHAVRDLDAACLGRLLADPDAAFTWPGTVLLKASRSSTVAELSLDSGRRLIYKRFPLRCWQDSWLALLRPSQALRSWRQGHALLERGLPTARPLAMFQRLDQGKPTTGYLLTEKIEGARTLYHVMADRVSFQQKHQLLDHLAGLLRELHRRGMSHRDLKASNILVSKAASLEQESFHLWIIDLVGARRHRSAGRGHRVQNLARLNASSLQASQITQTDRLRFLLRYLQAGLKGRAGWKRWWRQVESATQAKVAQNQRRGRLLA